MREILFRGKLKADNLPNKKGDWVFGHFVILKDGDRDIPYIYGFGEVYPATVGQFTGLTDKNGKKIFEGDILRHDKGDLHEVVFEQRNGHAYFGWTINELETWDFDLDFLRQLEIVGNIHDNKELFYTVEPSAK